jgi:hypothetical protein
LALKIKPRPMTHIVTANHHPLITITSLRLVCSIMAVGGIDV